MRHPQWHDTQRPLVDRLQGSYPPLECLDLSERQRHQYRLGLQANQSLRILQPQRDGMAVAAIKSGPPQQREKRQRRTLNSNDSHDKLYSLTCPQYHSYTIALSGSECEGSQIWKPCVCVTWTWLRGASPDAPVVSRAFPKWKPPLQLSCCSTLRSGHNPFQRP